MIKALSATYEKDDDALLEIHLETTMNNLQRREFSGTDAAVRAALNDVCSMPPFVKITTPDHGTQHEETRLLSKVRIRDILALVIVLGENMFMRGPANWDFQLQEREWETLAMLSSRNGFDNMNEHMEIRLRVAARQAYQSAQK